MRQIDELERKETMKERKKLTERWKTQEKTKERKRFKQTGWMNIERKKARKNE